MVIQQVKYNPKLTLFLPADNLRRDPTGRDRAKRPQDHRQYEQTQASGSSRKGKLRLLLRNSTSSKTVGTNVLKQGNAVFRGGSCTAEGSFFSSTAFPPRIRGRKNTRRRAAPRPSAGQEADMGARQVEHSATIQPGGTATTLHPGGRATTLQPGGQVQMGH